ncbi:DUF4283 domain protein, partial [Trifolium medium]|nr:DUF4283 domain protein [Trifolium medium]
MDRTDVEDVLEIDVVPANIEKLKYSYVGTLWEIKEAENIQMSIAMEGFQDIRATVMGVDLILLSSGTAGGVRKTIDADKHWWQKKFSYIKPWSPLHRSSGRRIWVRIFGVPPHVWDW